MTFKQHTGLSLIELMVVLAVIGLLSALAYPSYMQHLARRDRLEAINLLYEAQQYLERYYAQNNRYSSDSDGLVPPVLPVRLQSTSTQASTRYAVSVQATLNNYTLTATPHNVSEQALFCDQLSLRLSHTNAKSALALDGTVLEPAAVSACWR
jgi:type IV pilus assembly protein PilE